MKKAGMLIAAILIAVASCAAQAIGTDADFKLALPSHPGQLQWHAEGFQIIQSSAKANGQEIGIRGKDQSGRLTFLGFLFLVPEQAPLTGAKCRDGAIQPEAKSNPTLKILVTRELARPNNPPVELVSYTEQGRDSKLEYVVRGFVATGDICGDLEFYSGGAISTDDADLKTIFQSYSFDSAYTPQVNDVLLYAQVLYQSGMYKAAAPIFEQALAKLSNDKTQ
jgi:hypothetical protein